MYRALRSARTLAAKLIKRQSGIPSRVLKRSLVAASLRNLEITAKRIPIPVERIGARQLKGKRAGRSVKIRRWYGDSGVAPRTFSPAWMGRHQRFYSTHKSRTGRPYRLVARSVARVWVDLIPEISDLAAETYARAMASYFRKTGI